VRVLLLNQFFWPDSAATSQLLTDVARGLVDRGHEVTVICAGGGYAPEDFANAPAVRIHRVNALPFVRGPLGRILSYASFFLTAAFEGLRLQRPDVVVTLTTPPLISLIGSFLQQWRGSRHFIWEMDVYPDVATDVDYFSRGGWIDRLTGWLADYSRHRCERILALGPCMEARLIARGIAADKIQVAENWADSAVIEAQPMRQQQGRLSLLYSGNLGLAHDIETLKGAIEELKEDARFQFVFAGGGTHHKELERWCNERGIHGVEFRSYSNRSSLGASLGSGDIGLVTQHARCLGSVVPSKIYGLMAAARPILFIGPAASTVSQVIRRFGCGWHIECGDAAGLSRLLRSLVSHPERVTDAARRAHRAFLNHYDREIGVARVCRLIGAEGHRPEQGRLGESEELLICSGFNRARGTP
jgi:colanic acid biosynthesis glycosyl transferase WcaI